MQRCVKPRSAIREDGVQLHSITMSTGNTHSPHRKARQPRYSPTNDCNPPELRPFSRSLSPNYKSPTADTMHRWQRCTVWTRSSPRLCCNSLQRCVCSRRAEAVVVGSATVEVTRCCFELRYRHQTAEMVKMATCEKEKRVRASVIQKFLNSWPRVFISDVLGGI